jgi:MerR family transcriptional regulator, light-induced transcriptional regulator
MKEQLTPKQVAYSMGVSEASLKRWCDKGLLAATRTAGGHRRLALATVIQFLRETGREPLRPEVLGLPPATGRGKPAIGRAVDQAVDALTAGDEERLRRLVLNLYLARHPVRHICDQVLAAAFHEIGHQWQGGRIEVYRERRACEMCIRVLFELRSTLPPVPDTAPLAVGGTAEGDPYQLPTAMVELALREAGWLAQSFGAGVPFGALCAAVREVRPRLFWLSVSSIASPADFLAGYAGLHDAASALGVPVVVGGRALTAAVRRQMRYTAYCDHMGHLTAFAATLHRTAGEAN